MRKNLKNIGFTFTGDNLSELDAIILTYCEGEFSRLEKDEQSRQYKKK
jgi:hypothetical protein